MIDILHHHRHICTYICCIYIYVYIHIYHIPCVYIYMYVMCIYNSSYIHVTYLNTVYVHYSVYVYIEYVYTYIYIYMCTILTGILASAARPLRFLPKDSKDLQGLGGFGVETKVWALGWRVQEP